MAKVIAHRDFDGVASAAVVAACEGVEYFFFTGAEGVHTAPREPQDVVVDLPYPGACRLWFDHHEGNLENLQFRGVDASSVPGKFAASPSCASVAASYYRERGKFPDHLSETVMWADIIDSMDYASVEEWLAENDGHVVDWSLDVPGERFRDAMANYAATALALSHAPISEVAADPVVKSRAAEAVKTRNHDCEAIKRYIRFLPEDSEERLAIVDFTSLRETERIDKNLVWVHHPAAVASLMVASMFQRGVKTNDLRFSLSRNFMRSAGGKNLSMSGILLDLDLGDGHDGAAGGRMKCKSKAEREDAASSIAKKILAVLR